MYRGSGRAGTSMARTLSSIARTVILAIETWMSDIKRPKSRVVIWFAIGMTCCLFGALCGLLLANYQHQLIAGTNECDSNPCQNGSKCVDGFNSYICVCLPGYVGTHCETDIDECLSAPCRNGGRCKDGVNTYSCICPAGYTGRRCQTDIDECLSAPCRNGGRCKDGVNTYSCICPAGYTGRRCQTDTDECASWPCRHNGNCVDGVNSYRCHCHDGFTGVNCERQYYRERERESTSYVGYVVGAVTSILGSAWYFGLLL